MKFFGHDEKALADEAIETIKKLISEIVYESSDDMGAAEWHAHLESVMVKLQSGTMTRDDAAADLGVYL